MKHVATVNDQYARDQLFDLVMKYKFPTAENRKTNKEVFEEMEKDGVVPKSWSSFNALSKFLARSSTNEGKRVENYLMEILIIFTRSIKVTDGDKFHIFFRKLTEDSRHQFIEWLGNSILWSGVPLDKVSEVLSNKLEEMGFMSAVDVRRYMPVKFKNKNMQARKLGKTFEKTGKKQKGAIN